MIVTADSLTAMTDTECLKAVKISLNITGGYQDDNISQYIQEAKNYLLSAGVNPAVIGSTLAIGWISRGVADLWNYGNGDTKLSEYFFQRADQLRMIEVTEDV